MEDQRFEEWLDGFAAGSFSDVELEELGAGTKHPTEADVRNLVREIQFLRRLTTRLYGRCRELGDEDTPLMKYASLAVEGVRPDEA